MFDELPREYRTPHKGAIARRLGKDVLKDVLGFGATAAVVLTNILAPPAIGNTVASTIPTSSKAGRTALKNTSEKSPNFRAEKSVGSISEQDKEKLRKATVQVIFWNKHSGKGSAGTGTLIVTSSNEVAVLTATHTGQMLTGSNPMGLLDGDSAPFKGSNRAVDFSKSPKEKNFRVVITNKGVNDELAEVENILVGPAEQTGDVMLLTLDPKTLSPALAKKVPIPASKILNGPPAKGSEAYLYGFRDDPHFKMDANAKVLGVAAIDDVRFNLGNGQFTNVEVDQKYLVLGGDWPTKDKSGCTNRTSGMTPMVSKGWITSTQSAEIGTIPGAAPDGDWKEVMDQVDPNATTTQYPSICLVAYPKRLERTRSSANLINYLLNGRGHFPRG